MARRKHRSKYESEVHLGFMAIIFLLVFLNVVSNFVIFKARSTQQEQTLGHLRRAAIAASREIQMKFPEPLSSRELERVRGQSGLTGLTLIPVKPADNSDIARRDWFRKVLRRFPPSLYPELADKLYRANIQELTRGSNSEYYYLYPIPAGAGSSLLVLTVDREDLAYLDDSRNTLMVVLLGAIGVVVAVYVLLSRFMFRPFRRLKEQAEQAGRPVEDTEDETEAVVEEYERVIRQLTATKTELLRLNEEIRDRADSLELFNRYLMDSSGSGVVTLDLEGRVQAMNDPAITMLNLPPGDYTGQDFATLVAGCDELMADVRRAFDDEAARGYREYAGMIRECPDTVLGVTLTDIRDRGEGITGLLLLINDLTELSRLRAELENRHRLAALGEMAGGLAHQIRNSLGAISGYATLLKKRLKGENLPCDQAESLLHESREADELINRFLSFARPFEYSPRETDLGEIVRECLDSFKVRQDRDAVELVSTCQSGIMVEADPILLKQAIGNVIDNALDSYDGLSGRVEVTVAGESGQAHVIVEDYGCGIPEDETDKIFTPFFSSRPSGTGLGLPLVAKVVSLHGGQVAIESNAGEGTRCLISLPLAEPAAAAANQEISHPA